jgi:hypothetical protein
LNKSQYDPAADSIGYIDIPVPRSDTNWQFPDEETADAAAIGLNGTLILEMKGDLETISIRDFPTEAELKNVKISDEVISPGLVVGASGAKRLYPIFKFGYVSSIPTETISARCCPDCGERAYTEWMIAANLVPGNSGAPIFFVPSTFKYNEKPKNSRAVLLGVQSISLLGADIAGMTPATYIIQAIRKLNLLDADLTINGQPFAAPTKNGPSPPASSIP